MDQSERLLGGLDRNFYNNTLFALIRSGEMDKAVQLVQSMEEQGIEPDITTHNTILKGTSYAVLFLTMPFFPITCFLFTSFCLL